MPDGPPWYGLLVYTATAGTQGTLVGLVEVADRFAVVLLAVLRQLEMCSSDPDAPIMILWRTLMTGLLTVQRATAAS